ncbi:hypothetical protein CHS0354_030675 [Potamilus streckersoni]|uniref:Uncharacterized protein n=1 Tax=Potamilus streckersoni TaxID=2493646 RepID=A0AAE0SUA4_9BIVA|nr:hypothetical protein CHS0354_030675 [Potamilus streckersoni]
MAMNLREAVTVAIALKCLILMMSTQSVKADSCFDSSDEMQFCDPFEFVKLTVVAKFSVGPKYTVKCRVNAVSKSDLGITAGKYVFLVIPKHYRCFLNFDINSNYTLLAKEDAGFFNTFGKIRMLIQENDRMNEADVSVLFVQKDSRTL